jgi:hypothetical protein
MGEAILGGRALLELTTLLDSDMRFDAGVDDTEGVACAFVAMGRQLFSIGSSARLAMCHTHLKPAAQLITHGQVAVRQQADC